jgi:hypothetical protein
VEEGWRRRVMEEKRGGGELEEGRRCEAGVQGRSRERRSEVEEVGGEEERSEEESKERGGKK